MGTRLFNEFLMIKTKINLNFFEIIFDVSDGSRYAHYVFDTCKPLTGKNTLNFEVSLPEFFSFAKIRIFTILMYLID